MSSLHNPRSVMYTEKIAKTTIPGGSGTKPAYSEYGFTYNGQQNYSSNFYGSVCSGLTAYVLQFKNFFISGKYRNGGLIPNFTTISKPNAQNVMPLDFIWHSGHICIITDIILDDCGNRRFIVISEQTSTTGCITAYTPELFEERLKNMSAQVRRYSDWERIE